MRMLVFPWAILTLALASLALPTFAEDRLVNMIPNSRSGETNQDAEPTITIDPHNFARMAASAFTWDNLTGGPMVTDTAPIYVSTDGGNTWDLAFIVPSKSGAGFPTGDITLSFSSTLSGAVAHQTSWLYGGILSSDCPATLKGCHDPSLPRRPMVVLRAQDPFSAALMTTLNTRTGNVDQPHTVSKTSGPHTITKTSGGTQDKLYVGFNNGFGNYPCPPSVAPNGRSSTLDVSLDAAVAAPTLTLDVIEARDCACQDGFAQVPAAHRDGTVYAAFIHDWSGTPRLVVVRDDNWGIGPAPFGNLTDPSDTAAGRFVTPRLSLPWGYMGGNRLGASNVSIAVDPSNSNRVYVAWGDGGPNANSETIHVRRSINRGVDWSDDLLTVTDAMNPEVAINTIGVVGVLYQSVVADHWKTYFTRSNDLDGTTFTLPGTLLANQSAKDPIGVYDPYIGDYASLVAWGSRFVGMFSASNYPDKGNFTPDVKFQREVDWATHKLYADAAHTIEVAPSIDPFFFEIDSSICDKLPRVVCDNICQSKPYLCYPIYDPWWWLKCPMCEVNLLIKLGDEFKQVTAFDSLGKKVGKFQRLREPVVEKGVTYNYGIRLKPENGVGYVLKAEPAAGKKLKGDFEPMYVVKTLEAPDAIH
jgi:hypothetical protein